MAVPGVNDAGANGEPGMRRCVEGSEKTLFIHNGDAGRDGGAVLANRDLHAGLREKAGARLGLECDLVEDDVFRVSRGNLQFVGAVAECVGRDGQNVDQVRFHEMELAEALMADIERFRADNGVRVNVCERHRQRGLRINVLVQSEKLPEDLRYTLTFVKAD